MSTIYTVAAIIDTGLRPMNFDVVLFSFHGLFTHAVTPVCLVLLYLWY